METLHSQKESVVMWFAASLVSVVALCHVSSWWEAPPVTAALLGGFTGFCVTMAFVSLRDVGEKR